MGQDSNKPDELHKEEGEFALKDSSNYASVTPTHEGMEVVEERFEEELTVEHDENDVAEVVSEEKSKKLLSKTEEARLKMKEAEELIVAVDNEVNEVHSVVEEHLSTFETEKSALASGALTTLTTLFEKVKYDYSKDELPEPFEVSLGTTKEKLKTSNISTGRSSGLIFSLLGVLGTAGAWIYFASKKTGTELDPASIDLAHLETISTDEKFQPMLNWIGGGMTGGEGNALFGIITIIVTSLLIGYFLYKMRVSMKENKNFKVASKISDQSHAYAEHQKESKTEMEKIDAHIQEMTPLVTDYRILLDEQAAKLQRVLHVEGELENAEYHLTSQHTMRESDQLMTRIEKLIDTAVSKEGRLNEDSIKALMEAKAAYGTYITKIYA